MWATVLALAGAHEPCRDYNADYWCARFRPQAHMAPPEAQARLFLLKRLRPALYAELLTPETVAHFANQHWANLWDQKAWPQLVAALQAAIALGHTRKPRSLWRNMWGSGWCARVAIPAKWHHRCAVELWRLSRCAPPAPPAVPFQKWVFDEGMWWLRWVTEPAPIDHCANNVAEWLRGQRGEERQSLTARWAVAQLADLGRLVDTPPLPPRRLV